MYARLPTTLSFLAEYRLEARRMIRRNMVGGHVVRRLGQSFDFHDFARYTAGDDIRRVDWQTSLRTHGMDALGDSEKWLIRRFLSEEQMTLYVSLDTRPSMLLPQIQHTPRGQTPPNVSKLQIALWIAEALTSVASLEHDAVIWHPLFGEHSGVNRIEEADQITSFYQRISDTFGRFSASSTVGENDTSRADEIINEDGFDRYFPPAAVWLIITDFYFTENAAKQLAARIRQAQEGRRWVILLDLDSWQYERAILEGGFRQIDGPWSPTKKLNVNEQRLDEVQARIVEHKRRMIEMIPRADQSVWEYPVHLQTVTDLQTFFEDSFRNDLVLKRLFMRDQQ